MRFVAGFLVFAGFAVPAAVITYAFMHPSGWAFVAAIFVSLSGANDASYGLSRLRRG